MLNAADESAKAIAELINNINLILEYYVPGFCLVFVYRRFRSMNSSASSEAIQFGTCIVLSYLLHMLWIAGKLSLIIAEVGILFFVINKSRSKRKSDKKRNLTYSILFFVIFSVGALLLFQASHKNEYIRVIYEIISAIILALDLVLLHENRYAKDAFSWVNNTTLSDTVFECSQMILPCDVIVHGEGKRIKGRMLNYDLAADDAWLLLDKCEILDDHGKLLKTWRCEPKYHQMLVPLSEVKCIEVEADHGKPVNYDEKRKESDVS